MAFLAKCNNSARIPLHSKIPASNTYVRRGIIEQDIGDQGLDDSVHGVVDVEHPVAEGLGQAAPGYIGGVKPGGVDREGAKRLPSGSISVPIGHLLAAHISPNSMSDVRGVGGLDQCQHDLSRAV